MPWSELVLGAPHTTVFFILIRVLLVACARGEGRTITGREREEEGGSGRGQEGAGGSMWHTKGDREGGKEEGEASAETTSTTAVREI
jgi:hypothetical protein